MMSANQPVGPRPAQQPARLRLRATRPTRVVFGLLFLALLAFCSGACTQAFLDQLNNPADPDAVAY